MKIPMTVLKATTFWPAALVSFVLFMVVLALAPPFLSLPLVLAAMTLLVVLATGRLEEPTVELMTGARTATVGEQQVMASVVDGLGRVGITELELLVRRRQCASTPAVTVLGRRSLVLTPGLVEAVCRGWVATEEVVALVVQAVAVRRARRPRAELAGLVATGPWRAVVMVFRGVGAAFAWLPFMGIAWALRGVVAVICVLQSVVEGRVAVGLLGGAVIALTYLVPAAGRALQARTEAIGDQFVVDQGLGGVLARFLTRYGHPTTVERLRHLEQQPPPPVPSPSTLLATQLMPLTSFSLN
ncbi:hypothetical protein [Nocardioides psychrotolerans]|uniref:hypothetical protein n=1 Tax=Nocardioides psychrotolerans TaxID=1005945 RepID=UPI0031379B18